MKPAMPATPPTSPAPTRSAPARSTFNSDGTLANVNGAAPASGNMTLTIPWAASTGLARADHRGQSGHGRRHLRPHPVRHRLDAERHHHRRFALRQRHRRDGRQGRHGDGAVLQRPVAGRLQDPGGDLHQSRRPGPGDRQRLYRHQGLAAPPTSTWPIPARPAASPAKSLEGSTVDLATEFTNLITTQRAYSALGPHHHHRGPDAAAAGTVADQLTISGKGP